MIFEEAWANADVIEGWFVEGEGELLYLHADSVPEDQCIVEVGCYRGKSASLLAATGRKTYLIDPSFHLVDAVRKMDNVTFWNATTEDCPDPKEPIGLLHIDGCHTDPWPLADFKRFDSLLAPGAFVLFHDIDDAPGVRKAVDALVGIGKIKPIARAGGLGAYILEDLNA